MINNYLKIAIRNLLRNKTFAVISIAGMAIGLTAFWLITLYVADELSYDRHHENADRIVRVAQHASWDGGNITQATSSAPFAKSLQDEFAEIQEATRIIPEGGGIIKHEEKALQADDIFFADKNIFDVFTYPFEYGDKATALARPESIVLTESLAKKLFDDPAKAINQTIYFENNYPNLVTGVIKDVPENSQLRFSALRSLPENYTSAWQNFNSYTYLLLKKGADYKQLESKMPLWAKKTIQKMMGIDDYKVMLQPLTSIHLQSDLQAEISSNSSMKRLYIFIATAVLILIIAIINYMNLSTARSSVRMKEVGVRKVLGSGRRRLISMFITEALIMTFLSALIAFLLVTLLIPYFNTLANKNLTVWRFGIYYTTLALVAFALVTGIISGSYPALFLSRFKTIPALRGQLGDLSNSILFRKSLVTFQFVITVIMIAGSLIIYRQLKFVSNKDLGFNKEQVLTFHIHDQNIRTQTAAMRTQLLQNTLIQGVAVCGNPIGNNDIGTNGFVFEKPDGSFSTSNKMAEELMIDENYIPTMDIKLVAGRNFSAAGEADKYTAALINETLAKDLGWKEPVGKRIRFNYGDKETGERVVVGVVKDFHTFSLQHKVEPMVMMMPPVASMGDNLYIKINTAKTADALAYIEKVYKQFDKNNPAEFNFLDQNFARQYAAEQRQEQLSLIFTVLAVLIACLGLFGLAAFTAQQRVKELGIRKLLGASVLSLTMMLSKSYISLVVIAICIATPIAWFAMNKWLQGFAYRTTASWWVFAAAGLLSILIALMTVSFQAIKAAIANPIKSLRTE
ncbi:MAG: ABC transporter permease [Chitinophagaceae bacterium]